MSELMQEALALRGKMVGLRRAIHRHPELGNQEYETAALVERELKSLGIETWRPLETAVVGMLRGALPGPTVAFRADMDALPIEETAPSPCKSEVPGVMHACGHDMHTAALLGAAHLLAARRDSLHGSVKFFFQPDEEGNGGAERMIAAGCMENPRVEAVFGAHVGTDHRVGTVGLRFGPAYAASNPFEITIHGRSAHGAEPQKGVDAIVIGCAVVNALQTMVSRELDPTDSAVVTVGRFEAGTAANIIADTARLRGILRCYGPEMRKKLCRRLRQIVEGVCLAMGGQAEITIHEGYAGVVNDQDAAERVQHCAERLLGAEKVELERVPTLGTEDFGAFMAKIPGCFYHIGVAREGRENAPIHNRNFDPDEDALPIAAALHAEIALSYLS